MGVIRTGDRGSTKHSEQREDGEKYELTDHFETKFEGEYQTS
jgi:hypothetical protein